MEGCGGDGDIEIIKRTLMLRLSNVHCIPCFATVVDSSTGFTRKFLFFWLLYYILEVSTSNVVRLDVCR